MIGQTLNNHYHITALLGEGAMGEVYRATDTQTGQEVAIKVITQKLALNSEMLERFRREGEALHQLRHANIVAFVEMFPLGQQQLIVMEYVAGGSLHKLISGGPLPVDRAVRITLELSDALARAHHINIIHRDIKPDNVLIAHDGTPKLTDFGIARLVSDTAHLTSTGTQLGTPYYMSPEAWEGKPVDAQADIWSLGVVLYEMLAGQVPFSGDTLVTVMNRVLTAPLPDLNSLRPDLPPQLMKIVQRMLARDKAERYRTMRQVAVDLEEVEAELKAKAQGTQLKALGPEIEARATHPQGEVTHVPETEKGKAKTGWTFPNCLLALVGVGALALACLIVTGGLSLWAMSGKLFPRATPVVQATAAPRLATPLSGEPTMAAPSPTQPPPSTDTPRPTDTPLPPTNTYTSVPITPTFSPTPQPPTPTFTPGANPTMVANRDGMVLVFVPAGEFLMGSQDSDPGAGNYEKPAHTVYLDAFWIDRTAVTNAKYAKCVQAGACQPPVPQNSYSRNSYFGDAQYDNYPVIYVSWNDAKAYCAWAGRRLLTEAEWEKAARGMDGRRYPWGNQVPDAGKLNYAGNVGDTVEVGQYPLGASPYGALDMAGNVWQWVADWYSDTYYAASPSQNPTGPESGDERVTRGGGWYSVAGVIRSANRDGYSPDARYGNVGIRCGRSP
jgi:formylglycine-generating enzyme required for sulfatase activity/tRNA A-37 threonylcarbamoyl transferase component Bud32